jgi:hypothetical protein
VFGVTMPGEGELGVEAVLWSVSPPVLVVFDSK